MPWLVGALAATLTVSGCAKDPGDDTGLPGGEEPARAFALEREPRWTSGALGLRTVLRTEMRGNTTVVLGTDSFSSIKLAVVSTDSGKVRWSVKTGDLLDEEAILDGTSAGSDHENQNLLIAGSGKDWSVLAPYGIPRSEDDINGKGNPSQKVTSPNVKKTGVAALSGQDGSLRWKTELEGTPLMLDTDGRTVLVAGDDDGGWLPMASHGIDATSGRKLWSRPRQWVSWLAGDTAMGGGRPNLAEDWNDDTDPDDGDALFGLDPRSGRQKWNMSGEYHASLLLGAVEGNAVATVNGERGTTEFETDSRQVVLDTETGEEKHELYFTDSHGDPASDTELKGEVNNCETDRTRSFGRGTLLACTNHARQLLTVRAGEHDEPVITRPAPRKDTGSQSEVHAVARGRVYLNDRPSERRSGIPLAFDRTGDILHKRLPGQIFAVGPRHIAVLIEKADSPGNLAMYRTTDGDSAPSIPSDRSS